MNRSMNRLILLALMALIGSALVAACSPAAPQPAVVDTQPITAAPADTAAAPPTAAPTLAPSATLVASTPTAVPPAPTDMPPTAAAIPTEVVALGLVQDGIAAWCLPPDATAGQVQASLNDPTTPPVNALVGQVSNGALEVRDLPASSCVFTYTFNQPVPADLKLQIYDQSSSGPWLTTALQPVSGKPEMAMVMLKHTMIVAPPLWDVNYRFSVVDSTGNELNQMAVGIHRWNVEACWNGRKPNVNTLRCPLAQDPHPWDPWYGTPFPTAKPKED